MEKFKTESGLEFPLTNIQGKDYLDVKWRVVWFNKEKPDWTIETEIEYEEIGKLVRYRCIIKNPDGKLMRMARKTKSIKNVDKDYDSAETGSIGRALALMGYGTANSAQDLEEGEVVDAPVEKQKLVPTKNTIETTFQQSEQLFAKMNLPSPNEVDPLATIPDGVHVGKALIELMEADSKQNFKYAHARVKDFNKNTPKYVRDYLALCREEGVI